MGRCAGTGVRSTALDRTPGRPANKPSPDPDPDPLWLPLQRVGADILSQRLTWRLVPVRGVRLAGIWARARHDRGGVVAQLSHRAAGAATRTWLHHRLPGRRGTAGAAGRRPTRHTHPGQHDSLAGGGPARCPAYDWWASRPPPPRRGAHHRGCHRSVPGHAGQPVRPPADRQRPVALIAGTRGCPAESDGRQWPGSWCAAGAAEAVPMLPQTTP